MNRVAQLLRRYAPIWPRLKVLLAAIGIAYCVAVVAGLLPYVGVSGGLDTMADAYAYWAADPSDPYDGAGLGVLHAYLYSPAFIQVLAPLQWLPWPVFAVGWFALHLVVLWRLNALWMLAIPLVADDTIRGNVHTFYAYALVAPIWMGVPLLSKITPGIVLLGLRQQRPALVGIAIAGAVTAVSVLLTPHLWAEWFGVLRSGVATQAGLTDFPYPLLVRLPFALILVVLARRRPWLLAVAMLVAMPQVWPGSFAVLAAIPRLNKSSASGTGNADR